MSPPIATSLYMASRDFVIPGTDGMCAVEDHLLDEDSPLTILDHYCNCPTTLEYNNTILVKTLNYT